MKDIVYRIGPWFSWKSVLIDLATRKSLFVLAFSFSYFAVFKNISIPTGFYNYIDKNIKLRVSASVFGDHLAENKIFPNTSTLQLTINSTADKTHVMMSTIQQKWQTA